MEKKLQRPYFTDYNLLILQDLLQAHYQILLIILLKEFTNMMIENVKLAELNAKIASAVLNIQEVNMLSI